MFTEFALSGEINHSVKTVLRFGLVFMAMLAILSAVAGVVFPFTSQTGLKGYLSVLLAVCFVPTLVGSIFVYAAQGSRSSADSFETSGLSEDAVREIRRDANSGASLGVELFYAGLAALGIVYAIYRNL